MLFKFTDESYSVAYIYASLACLLCFIFQKFDCPWHMVRKFFGIT